MDYRSISKKELCDRVKNEVTAISMNMIENNQGFESTDIQNDCSFVEDGILRGGER